PSSEIVMPHYLSSLGTNQNKDTLYILGGYGSRTGDQKINPGYIYDLIRYIPKTKTSEKLYSYENQEIEEFCLSNSMIINEEDASFYALAYSKYEYKNELKLIKGSLKKPILKIDNKTIPFNFHDIMSYVDLIYSPNQRKLYAITLFCNDNDLTNVKIYSIKAEPALEPAHNYKRNFPVEKNTKHILLYLFISIIVTVLVLIYFWRKKALSKSKKRVLISENDNKSSTTENKSNEQSTPLVEKINPNDDIIIVPSSNYAISLFGGFQVIDKNNNNITNKFTPLLKELFLLVYLKSFGAANNGISSAKLKELLWYDKSEKDARNNRAVNIARLKSLLESVGNITVSKSTGYWMVHINGDSLNIDYLSFLNITQNTSHKKEDIIHLMQILKRGDFLQNVTYEWLDKFKADVSENVINVLINYTNSNRTICNPSFLIQIADAVLLFDSINEEALSIKCKSLMKNGKHSLAKKTYDVFVKEYKVLYNEDYSLSFSNITND
ncbi:MAG: hypothetical protein DRJ10_06405, partial [Bacteroidetes bacterium]